MLLRKEDGRREWEGCPMKKTEGEGRKACTYRRWKERVGRLSNEEDRKRGYEGCT